MAKKRQKKDNKPRENAVKNNGSAAGKRSEQGATAARSAPPKTPTRASSEKKTKKEEEFPEKFPFWARLKIGKKRTTLVIDEEPVVNKKNKKTEDGFVHRETIHTPKKDYEKIEPNPDKTDPKPMYLKRPRKLPKRLFKAHNKKLDMPDDLKKRYEGNNDKKK